ncbi:hypothetical protein ABKN59_011987 [Abortiporus biennis]
MDLQWDCSKCDHFLDSSGKIAVFTKMAEIISTDPSRGHILNAPCYFLPTKWQKLVKKIQVMMLSMFEHYFRRKHWFQQSVMIMDDIAYALEKNRLVRPMARYLDAEIEKFLHVMTYGQTISMNDISKLFGWNDSPKSQGELRQILEDNTFVYRIYSMNEVYAIFDIPGPEIRRFVDIALGSQQIPPVVFKWLSWTQAPRTVWSLHIRASILDEMLPSFGQHLQILNLKWDISRSEIYTDISFGIDVLPALQTLVINYLYQRDVDAFCDVLLRTNTSSTLSCIRFWFSSFRKLSSPFKLRFGSQDSARDSDFGKVGGEHEYSKLDDTLAQLPRDVRIEIEEEYWKHLPKLKLKGVLKIPTASRWQ